MQSEETGDISVYYQHTGRVSLFSRVSLLARTRMFSMFTEYFHPDPDALVLDVGVTGDSSFPESNFFEKMYPYPHKIVCVGTEDGSHLMRVYPGLRYRRITAGQKLPFQDGEFDIVFSNAVLEHTGGDTAQRAFIRELCRVGRAFFITTPNRWFAIEHHTGLPLLHFLPRRLFRFIIRNTRFRYWSEETNLNLLSASDLMALFPPEIKPVLCRLRLAGFTSNLVVIGWVRSREMKQPEDLHGCGSSS